MRVAVTLSPASHRRLFPLLAALSLAGLSLAPIAPRVVAAQATVPTELLHNGSFEQTGPSWLAPWSLNVSGGDSATIAQDGSTRADGTYSAVATIGGSSWSSDAVQLAQGGINLSGGQPYIISFAAQASVSGTIGVALQPSGPSYNTIWSQAVDVGPNAPWTWTRTFTFVYTPPASQDNVSLVFNLGALHGQVWLDSIALATAPAGPGPSFAAAGQGKGIAWTDPAEYWGGYHAGIDGDLADMNRAGISWARVDMYYYPTPNPDFDYVVQDAQAHNIHLLVKVWKAPPGNDIGTDADRATYRAWLARMVNRYKYWVKDWEVFNEPDLHFYWNINNWPNSDPVAYDASVHRFVLHLQDSYPTIKAADPTATVLMGAVDEWTQERFVYQLIQENAYQYFDVMAVHPYENDPGKDVGRFLSLEARMAAQPGLAAKPIWVTEVGFNTSLSYHVGNVPTEQQKADDLTQVLPALHAAGASLPIFWYTLHENNGLSGYGLEQKGPNTPQTVYFPAFTAYQNLSLSGSGPPVSLPTATLIPPTATSVPPMATPVPPTATAAPPTAAAVPWTATSTPVPTPRALQVQPTAAAAPPAATATGTPSRPTSRPTATGTRRMSTPAVPLTLTGVPRGIVGGTMLSFRAQTAPRARLEVAVRVTTRKSAFVGHGHGRKRVMRTVMLYQVKREGSANRRGRFSARLAVRYKPAKATHALLVVTARTARAALTRTVQLTILPPRHPARRR